MIWNERNLLTQVHSPLIVRMHHTFQDPYNCYVVMDLLLGGDLKFHLGFTRKDGFLEREAKFYTAGVLLSLEYLHSLRKGYPRLTDLGISVQTPNLRFQSRSGTMAYMAPEIFRGSTKHGTPSDFFSLGVLTYELLLGRKPWNGGVRSHLERCPDVMKEFTDSAYDKYYPIELLDSTTGVNQKLSQSCRSFLRGLTFDWDGYLAHTLTPPFVPVVDEKKANCDTAAQDFDDVLSVNSRPERISAEDQEKFVGFEYNVDATNPITI
ncbi:hypothetical protein PHYSODRAFT_472578 [Phytophthora sojae]|uniref:Protein kinase domain-containing protein n=1 Tax=Phytophthora sojae (strain P6497) TaxID=1094619 RepID=G4YQ75_PHYSP|nr:hypothetical protein PHYSODRAFT_472578 [Phytophthora sojae]EGZ29579.1 hypothetical protein PHYSODRAFT_472578 [Phytophthora sojae]|eukprot:XP_009516854.1 hypothetical protein PHYSODRAFT_472578 [Phytophthora sojae]